MTDIMDVEEYRDMVRKKSGRSKFRNKREVRHGISFDSIAEADRYDELRALEKAGNIRALVTHPEYLLQPAFDYKGVKVRAIKYEADFEYVDSQDNITVIEDVKGFRTRVFNIKWKMLQYKYQNSKRHRLVLNFVGKKR